MSDPKFYITAVSNTELKYYDEETYAYLDNAKTTITVSAKVENVSASSDNGYYVFFDVGYLGNSGVPVRYKTVPYEITTSDGSVTTNSNMGSVKYNGVTCPPDNKSVTFIADSNDEATITDFSFDFEIPYSEVNSYTLFIRMALVVSKSTSLLSPVPDPSLQTYSTNRDSEGLQTEYVQNIWIKLDKGLLAVAPPISISDDNTSVLIGCNPTLYYDEESGEYDWKDHKNHFICRKDAEFNGPNGVSSLAGFHTDGDVVAEEVAASDIRHTATTTGNYIELSGTSIANDIYTDIHTFTCEQAGWYMFQAHISWGNSNVGIRNLRVIGPDYAPAWDRRMATGIASSLGIHQSVSGFCYLAAGNSLRFNVSQQSGSKLTISAWIDIIRF